VVKSGSVWVGSVAAVWGRGGGRLAVGKSGVDSGVRDKHSKKPVRLLGQATFKNVRTADKKIFVSAYIEPDTLERLTGSARPKENDIEGYALSISGAGIVTEGRYGEGLTKATAEEGAKWWIDWKNQNLEGLIIPKSQTPFAALWTDRYPTEKARNE